MSKTVRLSDIGDRLGVSAVTVSKALSGQKGVSEEMRERIVALADEMGYIRNTNRAERHTRKTYTIGVAVPERYLKEGESFYSELYRQVARKAQAAGSYAVLELITENAEKRHIMPQLIKDMRADCLIILGTFERGYSDYLENNLKLPAIFMDSTGHVAIHDAVVTNNMLGGYQMTNYLFNLGHRDIGFVGTRLITDSIDDRYFGYCKALLEHGIELRKDWILNDRDWKTNVTEYGPYFRLPEELPTAFFCNCDVTAALLIDKLEERGLRVPEDISVVGFDNCLLQMSTNIPLTTYALNIEQMAWEAVHMVIKKAEHPHEDRGMLYLSGHLIERQSAKRIGDPVPLI